ncbi:MAG: hypothetical protein K2K14_00680 [Ruminococcus sp.]|nr:hypothetical protein [Ruminococcus sp.]
MSHISMEEKLSDLKKVILELSNAGCSLSAENKKQSELLERQDGEISFLKGKLKELENDNNETINDNTDLQLKNSDLENELENLDNENQELIDEIEDLEKKNKSLNNRVGELEKENSKLKKAINDYEEAKKSKKSELQYKLNIAEERIEKLEKQLADKEQVNIYMSSLLDKIGNVQKSLDSLKDDNDNGITSENKCNQEDAEDSAVQTEKATEPPENPKNDEVKEELNFDDNKSAVDSYVKENNDEEFKPSCGTGGYQD